MKNKKYKNDKLRMITFTEKDLKKNIAYSLVRDRISIYDVFLSDVRKEVFNKYSKHGYSMELRSGDKKTLLMCG